MRLKEKVAIVTGAGRGIGEAIALKFAEEGANVVVADLVEANALEVAKKITECGGKAEPYVIDMTDQQSVKDMFAYVCKTAGTVDIIVNNAGINRDAMLHKMEKKQWEDVINVNLTGVFYGTQEAAKLMREKGYGRIVNIASEGIHGNIGQANYSAA